MRRGQKYLLSEDPAAATTMAQGGEVPALFPGIRGAVSLPGQGGTLLGFLVAQCPHRDLLRRGTQQQGSEECWTSSPGVRATLEAGKYKEHVTEFSRSLR